MRAGAILVEAETQVTQPISRDTALAALARSSARRGWAIARDLLGDPAEAEDVVQEALARACERYGDLRDPTALEGWFFRVLTNLCMRTLRRRRVGERVRRWLGLDVVKRVRDAGDVEVDLVDRAPAADEKLAGARDAARTLAAVERLAPMQRAALILRYGHDHSVPEIAELLGVGQGTVKTHLVRGLARLRETMGDDEEKMS
jgi:RNA polymerase sigma-70 factor (ECF subfamily)